jgi:hypothetical protein
MGKIAPCKFIRMAYLPMSSLAQLESLLETSSPSVNYATTILMSYCTVVDSVKVSSHLKAWKWAVFYCMALSRL